MGGKPFLAGPAAADFAPQLVACDPAGEQLVYAGYGRTLLYNRDPAVTVYLGPEGASVTDKRIHILDPLGTLVVSGKIDLWGLTSAGTAVVQVTPGAEQPTASPAQIAAQIALSGVSLLSRPTVVAKVAATGVAASGTVTLINAAPITQTGYEIAVTAQIPAAATVPAGDYVLTWTDSVSGQVVSTEKWRLAASSAAAQQYCGTGPTKGDTLTLAVTNLDPAQILTAAVTLTQNSRTYIRDDWRQLTFSAVPTFTNASYDPARNILVSTTPAVGAGAGATRIMALYAGKVTFCFIAGGIGSFCEINTITTSLPGSAVYVTPLTTVAGQIVDFTADLPRENCVAVLFNAGGAPNTLQLFGTISEQLA